MTLREAAGKRYTEYCFILDTLAAGARSGVTMGREYLVQEAKKAHILLSQYEVREILASLERMGYVKVSKGRGGTGSQKEGHVPGKGVDLINWMKYRPISQSHINFFFWKISVKTLNL